MNSKVPSSGSSSFSSSYSFSINVTRPSCSFITKGRVSVYVVSFASFANFPNLDPSAGIMGRVASVDEEALG